MGSKTRLRWFVVASLAAHGFAQNVTVPAVMDGVEGGGGTNIPFGSNLACRYQVLYDAQELPWSGPRVITGISLRPDFAPPGAPMASKQYLDVSVLVSTSPRTAADASSTFADNYGSDATWVAVHQLVQLPAQPAVAAGPRPANLHFWFTQPWAYGLTPAIGTQPPPTSLLVEIWIHAQPSGAYRIDNLGGCMAPVATFGAPGPLCTVPGKPPIELTSDVSMLAGSAYGWHVANADANVPFLLGIGATNTGNLLGVPSLPLPVPLFDPGNPALPSPGLAFLGYPAPDCWLAIDPLLWLGGTCDAQGVGSVISSIPAGRDVVGSTWFAQALVIAPTANPLRLLTSVGRHATVCGPLGVARIFAFYDGAAVPPQPLPLAGSAQYGVGPVIEVH